MAGNQVIERPLSEAQSIYDQLCDKRRKLNGHTKLRSDALMGIPRYKKLTEEITKTRGERQGVTASFDSKEPGHKERIESTKDEIDFLEGKLGAIALEHFKKTGKKLEVGKKLRSGKIQKVEIGFAVRTLTLF